LYSNNDTKIQKIFHLLTLFLPNHTTKIESHTHRQRLGDPASRPNPRASTAKHTPPNITNTSAPTTTARCSAGANANNKAPQQRRIHTPTPMGKTQ
jgi:hypothetical protein